MSEAQRAIAFAKAEADGNDFLLVGADLVGERERAAFARAACDRHLGIGADGVEFFRIRAGSGTGAIELTLFNSDGSEAEISGNGSRCAAVLCAARTGCSAIDVITAAGTRSARICGQRDRLWEVEMDMGRPRFESDAIPMRLPGGKQESVRDYPLEVNERECRITALSMGNPQCCVLVTEFPDDWQRLAAAIEAHPVFPQHTNVEFVRVRNPSEIEIRIYERGAGPTRSSGTGSCAAAVTAILHGMVASPVRVVTPGGIQTVEWAGGSVLLRGPARLIAEGGFFWP